MKRRLDLSVGQRLAMGFGAAGVLIVLMGSASHVWTGRVEAIRSRLQSVVAPRAEAAARLELAVLSMGIAARNYLLDPQEARRSAYADAEQAVLRELERLNELPGAPEDRGALERLPDRFARYRKVAGEIMEAARSRAKVQAMEPELSAARQLLLADVHAAAALEQHQLETLRATVTDAVSALDRNTIGFGALLVVVLAFTAVVTTRSVRIPALELVSSARRLGAGDFDHAVALAGDDPERPRRDELVALAHAFGRMALELRTREERLRAGTALAVALARSLERWRVCAAGLGVIVDHLGVECAAVYLADEDGKLRLEHGVGLAGGDEVLLPGQGIPGRAAAGRRTVLVGDVSADSPFTLRLGVDRQAPRTVAAVPMVLQDRNVVGVLVVASARPLAADAVEFLERGAAQLGVSVQNARGHERVERLVAELNEKNARLQAQQEELQSQNEELQAQQEELQSQNEELQAQGEELRRTEEALLQTDRNKNEFLAVLSHELRNPLAPIQNSLHVLDRAPPGSEQARRAQSVMARQVRHLTRLVEDLLDVTRISNGKVRLRRTAVDLGALVRQAAEDNAAQFAACGVELRVDVSAEPRVEGDPARLSQIIGNLLQNAAKFTPAGGSVRVVLEAAGATARIRVRDSGVGIDAPTLERLFEPFMQADGTLARTNGGLGLGLALVKGLVELHGGAVRAASEGPGKGSEFVVELPTNEGRVATPPPSAAPAIPRRRVLVIEDNVDAAESLRDALALAGHEVEVEGLGAAGLARARQWKPDVVLCDIGLPDMEGHEVARAFRADPVLRSVLLVALTGYALPEDLARAREAGFDEHLAKPPSLGRLGELLSAAGTAPAVTS
jgi:signal transduction histidine kinase/ActR/RegA family two-component response regulator/HAMP domain-containing protein